MRDAQSERERKVLLESFTAGWQAALAMNIRDPRVLAVIESCFELWLEEAVDEAEVLGLVFRGRYDIPGPGMRPARAKGSTPAEASSGRHTRLAEDRDFAV
jgi:hypothetical protein